MKVATFNSGLNKIQSSHETERNVLVYKLKAHYSSILLLDEKLLSVLTFWFKRLTDWQKGFSHTGNFSDIKRNLNQFQ